MTSTPTISRLLVAFAALLLLPIVIIGCGQPAKPSDTTPGVIHIEPDSETGTSLATAVGDVPLVFTNQFFPSEHGDRFEEENDVSSQIDEVLSNIESALEVAGTNLEGLVRLHVYLAEDSLSEVVLQRLAEVLPEGARPAVTFVSGRPTRSGAILSMDAVAVTSEAFATDRRNLYRADRPNRLENGSDAAVLSPGRKIFISGQAEMADTLPEATQRTMRGLLATLAYAGASAKDIVQIKAFINPAEEYEAAKKEIARFFRHQEVPPIITLEWQHGSFPTEIELVASAPSDAHAEAIASYYAPPWSEQMTTFSRLVDVHHGGLLFTSGLYGEEGQSGESQARTIFDTLSRLLNEAGSDFDHLVKGTYYPSTESARQDLFNVRTDFFNPDRPPAASLAEVGGVGRVGATLNVDMISVIPAPPE